MNQIDYWFYYQMGLKLYHRRLFSSKWGIYVYSCTLSSWIILPYLYVISHYYLLHILLITIITDNNNYTYFNESVLFVGQNLFTDRQSLSWTRVTRIIEPYLWLTLSLNLNCYHLSAACGFPWVSEQEQEIKKLNHICDSLSHSF